MLDAQLFLGFQKTTQFEALLHHSNPYMVSMFTSGGDYLTILEHRKKTYLGKYLPKPPCLLDEIFNIELNLLSLVRKLAPKFLLPSTSFIFLTVPTVDGK